jgi:plasmid stability protein
VPGPVRERTLVRTWLPDEAASQLRHRAEENERTLAAEARVAIQRYLESSEAAGQGGSTRDGGSRHVEP